MPKVLIPFNEARRLIQHGDILLFRGTGIISKLLTISGASPYTHVGVASWCGDNLQCIEMREFIGGRCISLEQYLPFSSSHIDVYRPISPITIPYFDVETRTVKENVITYDAKKVVDGMRTLTGTQYGWKRIGYLAKRHLPFFRVFCRVEEGSFDDELLDTWNKVCSTAVAYYARMGYTDLVRNRADSTIEPGDLASSPLLRYFFTITA